MSLLDEGEDRWYCYRDDVIMIHGVEMIWRDNRYQPSEERFQADQIDDTQLFDQPSHQASAVHCFYCGKKMPNDANFCRYCGRQQLVPD